MNALLRRLRAFRVPDFCEWGTLPIRTGNLICLNLQWICAALAIRK